jgi:hypothetical protein
LTTSRSLRKPRSAWCGWMPSARAHGCSLFVAGPFRWRRGTWRCWL